MNTSLDSLKNMKRLLFKIPLKPLQGDRFQPTGFPSLGAATYQTSGGLQLLVESAQSMANRFERVCWDDVTSSPVAALANISHVTVRRRNAFLTDTMLEAHRLNSPYLLENKDDPTFFDNLKTELGGLDVGPIDRKRLAQVLLKYDVGSLLHGVFLAKKDLAGGRLRVARAMSGFIEATGVQVAASGGVKNDHVSPSVESSDVARGFGNVPFARDEFTAEHILFYVNIDLAQIRGYGLGEHVERLLTLLALHRLRRLLDGDLRLRTACDLEPSVDEIRSTRGDFVLPSLAELESGLPATIEPCRSLMTHTTTAFESELKKGRGETEDATESEDETADGQE